MSTSAFLDKYFECIDSMPQELQRYVTQLREIEIEKRDLFREMERLRGELMVAVEKGSRQQKVLFRQLQECLLKVREVGNTKLDISAQMLDTVEEYTQQLGIRAKELESNPRGEELLFHHAPSRYSNSQYPSYKGDSPSVNNGGLPEVKSASSKRNNSSSKRPRHTASSSGGDKASSQEDDAPLLGNGSGAVGGAGGMAGGGGKEGGGGGGSGGGRSSKEASLGGGSVSTLVVSSGGSVTTSGGASNGKPPKKKVKTMKKSSKGTVTKDKDAPPPAPPPAHVPMPDLTSQPLDPNEPTYCLCQQVSFGEMIGCDNDNCQIEWFHFQCVGLVSKPKGKWYCPQCAQERKAKSGK